jgi:membrane protease YdiL (CAAX protease family)
VLAAILLLASGVPFPLGGLLIGPASLALALLTFLATEPNPGDLAPGAELPRIRLRVAIVAAVIVLTGIRALEFHGVIPPGSVPLWSDLSDGLVDLGDGWFGNGFLLANPVLYFGVPVALLLLAGATWKELGLGWGHRVGRVVLLWAAIPVAFLAIALASGQLTPARLGGSLVSNAFQNGFFEEFLFRGALQGGLRRLIGPAWALVIQALAFGAWHLGLGFTNTEDAGLLPALASVTVFQAVLGLSFGVILERTRNLVAPSVAHVLVNTAAGG